MDTNEKLDYRIQGATAYHKYRIAKEEDNSDIEAPTNPYPEDTEKAKYWNEGYLDASFDGCSNI